MVSGEGKNYGFWRGLLHARIDVSSPFMVAKWAGAGTFSWLVYLLIFSSAVSYLYFQSAQTAQAASIIAVFIAFNAGTLVATYLATLVDGPQQNEESGENPFALSLQAIFVESVAVAGTLLFVAGCYVVDKFEPIVGYFTTNKEDLANARKLAIKVGESSHTPFLTGYIKLIVTKHEVLITLAIFVILLVGVMWVAHEGFALLRRRHRIDVRFGGTHKNEGDPPISSQGLKQRIEYLRQLDSQLAAKATRETALADDHTQRAAEAELEIQAYEAELQALQKETDLILQDKAAYCEVLAVVTAQHEVLKAKTDDPERSRTRKFFAKIADLTETAAGLVKTGDRSFEDACASLQRRADDAQAACNNAKASKTQHETAAEEHRAEAARLAEEARTLTVEIADLDTLAAKIDQTNDEWSKPFEWKAEVHARSFKVSHLIPSANYNAGVLEDAQLDKVESVHGSTLFLFIFASLFLVIGDVLLDIYRFDGSLAGALTSSKFDWRMLIGFACLTTLFFWSTKAVSMLGFMGSWRAIMIAPTSRPKDSASEVETDHDRMISVVIANTIAVAVFSVILALIIWSLVVSVDELKDDHPARYFVAGLRYMPVLPLLGIAAGLAVVAPIAVFIFERFMRGDINLKGILKRLEFVALVLIVVLIAGGFAAVGSFLGTKAQKLIAVDLPVTPIGQSKIQEAQMTCPFVTYASGQAGMTAAWVFADTVRAEPNLARCNLAIGKYDRNRVPTYAVILGGASQEGTAEDELKRSKVRASNVWDTLQRSYSNAQGPVTAPLHVYVVSLGQYERRQGEPKLKPEETAYQRPAAVVLGDQDDPMAHSGSNDAVIARIAALMPPAYRWFNDGHYKKIVVEQFDLCADGQKLQNRSTCPVVQAAKPAPAKPH
jgi:hypothetical protein